jgi:predicted aspartyl protease
MVDLEVIAPTGHRLVDAALVDTGADCSAFPLHWMRRLGIRKKDCLVRTFETAGGPAKQWRFRDGLQAVILGRRIGLEACFVDTPVALLGREDFLAHFRVSFDQRQCRFTIRPY